MEITFQSQIVGMLGVYQTGVRSGFFGLLKRDLFPTSRASEEYTIAELIHKINNYIYWYNEKRVRAGLGYKTIKQTREEYSRQQAA